MILSTDAEKSIEKIQLSFPIKTLNKVRMKDNFLKMTLRNIIEKFTANFILHGERLQERTMSVFTISLQHGTGDSIQGD